MNLVQHSPVSSRTTVLACTVLALASGARSTAAQGLTEQASVSSAGTDANAAAYEPVLSADGRFVAFVSTASNLAPGAIAFGVFVRDRRTGTTELASVSSSGIPAYGTTDRCSISADGRWMAFDTSADNLVAGHSSANPFGYDVYVHDRLTGSTVQASRSSAGQPGFGESYDATISANGRFVVFESRAANLVAGDTNGWTDVFVRDLVLGTTERVNVSSAGQQDDYTGAFDPQGTETGPPVISADGRYVAFNSLGSNLVPGDTNNRYDVFVHDRTTGVTERVSVTDAGLQPSNYSAQPSISADGRYVAFWSAANDLVPGDTTYGVNVYVRDRVAGTTRRVDVSATGAHGGGAAYSPQISADGRFVAFQSYSSDLVPGDTNAHGDAFVHDLWSGATTRVSVASSGAQANQLSGFEGLAISADGSTVAFSSFARFSASDGDGIEDVYVHERAPDQPLVYCSAKLNSQGCVPSIAAAGIPSASGSAAFTISAANLINRQRATLIYAFGPASIPFQGGTLCVSDPVRRLPSQNTLGNPTGIDCTGSFAFDFAARIRSGVDAGLVPGTVVYAQVLYNDPSDPAGRGMTDALEFAIRP